MCFFLFFLIRRWEILQLLLFIESSSNRPGPVHEPHKLWARLCRSLPRTYLLVLISLAGSSAQTHIYLGCESVHSRDSNLTKTAFYVQTVTYRLIFLDVMLPRIKRSLTQHFWVSRNSERIRVILILVKIGRWLSKWPSGIFVLDAHSCLARALPLRAFTMGDRKQVLGYMQHVGRVLEGLSWTQTTPALMSHYANRKPYG